MMKRMMLAAAVAAIALVSTVALASLYLWNEAKRPPISLADALARAEKLLGEDAANRYCVDVSLFGDASGEGKEGAWNLLFAAADGSKKIVYIDMQGKGDVKPWNGPIDWKKTDGRRIDLADVQRRLEELFAKEHIKASFGAHQDRLLVTYNARDFQIYPQREDGAYGEELKKVSGPGGDGIWLQIQIVDKPDERAYGFNDGPYWKWVRGTYLLTQPGRFLAVDLRYGPNVKYEVARQIWEIFGDPTPHG
jgi:hypothetical protein